VPVSTGPRGPAGAGRGRLRAGHADREQLIEELKTAFVDGRLTKDELAARTGRALRARTHADLAALTADLPAGPAVKPVPVVAAAADPAVLALAEAALAAAAAAEAVPAPSAAAEPVPAVPAASPAPAIRRPMAKAGAVSGICLAGAVAAMKLAFYFDPGSGSGPHPDQSWARWFVVLASIAVIMAVLALGLGVAISIERRRSRGQLPPRPGPGNPAPGSGQRGETGQGPVPPGHRTDETQTDLRARTSRQRGRRTLAGAGRAPGGARPAAGTA
jgi:DUF1707 SHOCT-like domain